jgi:hypothetical protein
VAAIWNIKDLPLPPNLTYEIQLSDISKCNEHFYFSQECLDEVQCKGRIRPETSFVKFKMSAPIYKKYGKTIHRIYVFITFTARSVHG